MFKKRGEIIRASLALVCEACCVTEAELRESRSRDATDARWVLVRMLGTKASDSDIGSVIGRTRQGVCHLRNDRARMSDAVLREVAEELGKQIASNGQAKSLGGVE